MPRLFRSVMIVLTLAALIPLGLLLKARVTDSPLPRFMVVFDMDNQNRYKAQQASPLFADGRAMRPPVEGAVARGEPVGDAHYLEGRDGDGWAEGFPRPVDEAALRRGRERYGVFCAPCHGLDGAGNGIVSVRAERLMEGTWVLPTNLADDVVAARPVGHIYNTIRNGIRKMPAYGAQIPVDDRWAITAYVRALQRSRRATLDDVPPEARAALAAGE